MTRYLLDTGIAGDFVNRRRGVYERARRAVADGHRIGIGLPVLAELHYGVEYSASAERNRVLLRGALADLILWPLTEEATEIYGRVRADLLGWWVVQAIDLLVAAIALSLKHCTVVFERQRSDGRTRAKLVGRELGDLRRSADGATHAHRRGGRRGEVTGAGGDHAYPAARRASRIPPLPVREGPGQRRRPVPGRTRSTNGACATRRRTHSTRTPPRSRRCSTTWPACPRDPLCLAWLPRAVGRRSVQQFVVLQRDAESGR